MRRYPINPAEMLASLWRHRELIQSATRREVLGRYRGSYLGLLWSFVNPLFLLAVYTFIFRAVLHSRWGMHGESETEFALVLFAGLIIFNLFSECIHRAPTLILANANYVKKVVYPLEILPCISLLTALYHACISLVVWLLAYSLLIDTPALTVVFLPCVILPFCVLLMGISWLLASLGVFLRDIAQAVGVSTTALLFLSPIFYPSSALPEQYRGLLNFNPLTIIVEQTHAILLWRQLPDFKLLASYWLLSLCIAWMGFAWFQKTRKGFGDVL